MNDNLKEVIQDLEDGNITDDDLLSLMTAMEKVTTTIAKASLQLGVTNTAVNSARKRGKIVGHQFHDGWFLSQNSVVHYAKNRLNQGPTRSGVLNLRAA